MLTEALEATAFTAGAQLLGEQLKSGAEAIMTRLWHLMLQTLHHVRDRGVTDDSQQSGFSGKGCGQIGAGQ